MQPRPSKTSSPPPPVVSQRSAVAEVLLTVTFPSFLGKKLPGTRVAKPQDLPPAFWVSLWMRTLAGAPSQG